MSRRVGVSPVPPGPPTFTLMQVSGLVNGLSSALVRSVRRRSFDKLFDTFSSRNPSFAGRSRAPLWGLLWASHSVTARCCSLCRPRLGRAVSSPRTARVIVCARRSRLGGAGRGRSPQRARRTRTVPARSCSVAGHPLLMASVSQPGVSWQSRPPVSLTLGPGRVSRAPHHQRSPVRSDTSPRSSR